MKLLFFIGELSEGGAERVISILANNLVNDFDVEILTYYENEIFYELDERIAVNCVECNTGTKSKIRNLSWVRNYFGNNGDVIISFLAPFNMYALAANPNKPIIVADRNDPNYLPSNPTLRRIRDILYRRADAVITQTDNNKKYFDYLGNKVHTIYNPVNMDRYVGIALSTNKENKIVSVGRLMPQKNHKILIDAFKEVTKEHPDYKLKIYGDGPYKDELIEYIEKSEMDDSVVLCGQHKDIFDQIKNAKMYVLSSDYEGMPNSLIEAMCLGLPCISTKVSGATDLIKDKENGLLVGIGNQKELVESIKLLIENPELSEELAKEAILINKKLEVNTIVEQWKDIINKIKK